MGMGRATRVSPPLLAHENSTFQGHTRAPRVRTERSTMDFRAATSDSSNGHDRHRSRDSDSELSVRLGRNIEAPGRSRRRRRGRIWCRGGAIAAAQCEDKHELTFDCGLSTVDS
jgi:hypothetical protein